jgi:hypothetical protein
MNAVRACEGETQHLKITGKTSRLGRLRLVVWARMTEKEMAGVEIAWQACGGAPRLRLFA